MIFALTQRWPKFIIVPPIILNFRSLVSFAEGFTFPIAKIYRVVVVWLYEETNDYDGLRVMPQAPRKQRSKHAWTAMLWIFKILFPVLGRSLFKSIIENPLCRGSFRALVYGR